VTTGANRVEEPAGDEAGAPPETLAEYEPDEDAVEDYAARDRETTTYAHETEYAMRATAPRESRARPTMPEESLHSAMEPSGLANSSSQSVRFRAELIEAYYEMPSTEVEDTTSRSGLSPYVTVTGGKEVPRDISAQPGSENNPLKKSVDLSIAELPSFDFAYFDGSACSSAVLISGDVHIGSDGRVISYRLKADRSARAVLNAYAGHLRTNRILPPRRNGSPVSVEYSFIATLYCVSTD
jgi:hypothetical protein